MTAPATTALTLLGYWDTTQMVPLTLEGVYDGTTMDTGVTLDVLLPTKVPNNPPPPPPGSTTMLYGVSGTPTNVAFAAGYNQQVATLHCKGGYVYGQGTSYSSIAAAPASHPIVYQTLQTTRSQFDALIATFPATRLGKVYLGFDNEIDRKIKKGVYSMATWQGICDALFDAIAASGKNYIVPMVGLQYQALLEYNKGHTTTDNGANNLPDYLRPGLQHIAWSTYAAKKVVSGHEVAGYSPIVMPETIGKYMDTIAPIGWSSVAGWSVGDAYLADPVTIQNRINWFLDSSANFADAGALYYLWFDIDWSSGDYRIETDPALLAAWTARLQAIGQW